MPRHLTSILLLVGILTLVGCGEAQKSSNMMKKDRAPSKDKDRAFRERAEEGVRQDALAGGEEKQPEKQPALRPRKVIYNGHVDLVVQDFEVAEFKLREILETYKAFIEKSEVHGEPNEPRSGIWKLRVPAAKFESLLEAMCKLGEPRQRKVESDDVSDRYYDTEATAENLEAREKALRKLYSEKIAASKLSELIEVDREITNVRGQINRLRGQLKGWDSLADYSSITVTIRDRKGYIPPESPEYSTQLGRAWGDSVAGLVATGKTILLILVALTPWLIALLLLGAVALVLRMVARLFRRSRKEGPPQPPAVVQPM